ncbi:neurochondrin [Xenopus laevis]|uniref:Neurochondrin n=2 Tax=Xenopus laevis TaxID=8355 RepID=NCDN_XENLA|nr:neurochondrin [Xenopus laevis]Q640K1.1 RecName: Full=Neurochondrin [Xenopus laevis]AAH82624.1 Ncdn protein [Xenopus laevis]
MPNTTEEQSDEVNNLALEKCLKVLQEAQTDNEQFAALLLVTKCAQAQEINNETRRRIFDAVGFTFPNRLLFSNSVPEGCPQNLFKSLGITLLACFSTDPVLAVHPQVVNKIPIFNETINISCQSGNKEVVSMVEDAYQCLLGILASPQGPKNLLSHGSIPYLCQAYMNRNHFWEKALQILTSLLTVLPPKCWKKSCTDLQLLLTRLSEEFGKEEGEWKFQLADLLPIFLPPSPILLETSWGKQCLKQLCKGLLKILSNKLSISQRDPALKLAACLANSYGSSWIMAENKVVRSRFLALIVNLACVEVRMALEEPEPLTSRQSVITACYALVEMGILACTKEEKHPVLGKEQKLQLIGVMQEACAAIIYYLQQVGWEKQEDPFLLASVRLLGAWLAEETACLKLEVIQLLPFLVHYMRTCHQRSVICSKLPKEVSQVALLSNSWGNIWPGDAIRFLLPALCHLSAEEVPRKVLISEGVPALLCDYFQLQWDVLFAEDEPEGLQSAAELSLQTCCGVFLNLVVTEPTFVGQESCFVSLMKLLMQSLPTLLTKEGHLVLVANFSTLGLMMSRLLAENSVLHESNAEEFFKAAIHFLSHSHVPSCQTDAGKPVITLSESYSEAWEEISELWFLGVQAFSSCVHLLPWLSALVLRSSWLQDTLCLLDNVSPKSVDSDLVTALQGMLTELAQSSSCCRDVIREKGGAEKANLYGMAALEQCLAELS